MCGRYTFWHWKMAQRAFALQREAEYADRYNVAPTQSVPAVRRSDDGNELTMMRWGLIPSWAKDTKISASLINARSETVATKPSFRSAFKRGRRCLIPASGFYEWKKIDPKTKQPYLIGLKEDGLFAFAGLWETWKAPDGGNVIESCTILTTEANSMMEGLHDRMPVILDPSDYAAWLDPEIPSEGLSTLLAPFPPERMQAVAVSTLVNNARNESPECVVPINVKGANGDLFPDAV